MAAKYIPHALERMNERGISRELLEEVLQSPDSINDGYLGRKVAQKRINGRLIGLFTRPWITTWWSSLPTSLQK